jgi:hypothetical protein
MKTAPFGAKEAGSNALRKRESIFEIVTWLANAVADHHRIVPYPPPNAPH